MSFDFTMFYEWNGMELIHEKANSYFRYEYGNGIVFALDVRLSYEPASGTTHRVRKTSFRFSIRVSF